MDIVAPTSAGLGAEAYFIRAPAVLERGAGVTELARVDGVVVAVEQKSSVLGTAFHPEISADPSWLRSVERVEPPSMRPTRSMTRSQFAGISSRNSSD